jgi:hypothetical protein
VTMSSTLHSHLGITTLSPVYPGCICLQISLHLWSSSAAFLLLLQWISKCNQRVVEPVEPMSKVSDGQIPHMPQEKESRALRLLQYNQQREQAALEYQMKAAGLKVRAATRHGGSCGVQGLMMTFNPGRVVASLALNSCCATAAAGRPVT